MNNPISDTDSAGTILPDDPDPFDVTTPAPRPSGSRVPWKVIGIGAAVLVVGAVVVALVATGVGQSLFDPPERAVERYYGAIEKHDFKQVSAGLCDETLKGVALNVDDSERLVTELMKQMLPPEIKIKIQWKYSDLRFSRVDVTQGTAKVLAEGSVRLFEEGTNIGFTLPLKMQHDLQRSKTGWCIINVL